ncbi:hypothetical protein OIU84_025050 [Salix udensis]|uniref:Uncharacterized protein n=1 Tax=Salix udensis TaxID=889485 RepID=A0AAD6KKW8_9ROSI|nr:hypothetical protein OIU84_025050 [Salix udensis]
MNSSPTNGILSLLDASSWPSVFIEAALTGHYLRSSPRPRPFETYGLAQLQGGYKNESTGPSSSFDFPLAAAIVFDSKSQIAISDC